MRLFATFCLVTVAALVNHPPALAQEAKGAGKWTALSLRVERPAPGEERDFSSGIRVTLLLQLEGKTIVAVASKESTLDIFKDDRGTDLLANSPGLPSFLPIALDKLGPDSGKCQLILKAPQWPVTGASKVHLRGKISVRAAKGEKVVQIKDQLLLPGAKRGEVPLPELEGLKLSVDKSPLTPKYSLVRLSYDRPLKALQILDAAGNVIVSGGNRHASELSMGTRFSLYLKLPMKLDRATLRVTYYESVESVMVPFDLEMGIGL